MKNKNVSKSVKNGQIVHTRDEYFYGQGNYRKPGYERKGNYRMAVVVDSNRDDELAVVKLTTSKIGKQIGNTKSNYKPFVSTKDCDNKNIIVSLKFVLSKKSFSENEANAVKNDCVNNKFNGKENRKRLFNLKWNKKSTNK